MCHASLLPQRRYETFTIRYVAPFAPDSPQIYRWWREYSLRRTEEAEEGQLEGCRIVTAVMAVSERYLLPRCRRNNIIRFINSNRFTRLRLVGISRMTELRNECEPDDIRY